MDIAPGADILALADRLGEPFEAAMAAGDAHHVRQEDGPMTDEQASYIGYLSRRLGRLPDGRLLTFSQAKAKITELLIRLSAQG